MKRVHWILPILLITAHLVSAQDYIPCIETMGGEYDEESQNCIEHGTIEINIEYPAWILDYPFIVETIEPYIDESRADFLNSGLNFFQERTLTLDIYYVEHHYSEEIVTLEFRSLTDYGGLYPISALQTFTFDLASEQHLTFDDLFLSDSDPLAIIAPRTSEEACFSCFLADENAAQNTANYENFILTETELIFLFPPVRMGAMNAGIMSVVFSLDEFDGMLTIPEN